MHMRYEDWKVLLIKFRAELDLNPPDDNKPWGMTSHDLLTLTEKLLGDRPAEYQSKMSSQGERLTLDFASRDELTAFSAAYSQWIHGVQPVFDET
jgi:hypothetical protein